MRRPITGNRKRSTRSPRTISTVGWEGQRHDDRDDAHHHRAEAEAAQRGVGHEHHADHRERERGAAEDDGARRPPWVATTT
jgi:hypothetical protein